MSDRSDNSSTSASDPLCTGESGILRLVEGMGIARSSAIMLGHLGKTVHRPPRDAAGRSTLGEDTVTEYVFHWWRSGKIQASGDCVKLRATSDLHGAALALRYFARLGCDISAPLAHIDMTGSDGARRTLLVDEVLNWLQRPEHAEFIEREELAVLFE